MRKIISALLVGLGVISIVVPEHNADAQLIVYSNLCCDAWGNVRCTINPSPINTGCWCYGQGAGTVC